jgi:hypothetical protein
MTSADTQIIAKGTNQPRSPPPRFAVTLLLESKTTLIDR